MAGDVGELLEVFVGTPQFLHRGFELLGALPDQFVQTYLVLLLFVNIGDCPQPGGNGSGLVPHGRGSGQVPTVGPVGPPEAIFRHIGFAGVQGLSYFFDRFGQVVGMGGHFPAVLERFFDALPRIIVPALVDEG